MKPAATSNTAARRVPMVSVLSLVLCALLAFEWSRSYHKADVAAVFLPGGYAQGVASHAGTETILVSTLCIYGRSCTGLWKTLSTDHFEELSHDIVRPEKHSHSFGGFAIGVAPVDLDVKATYAALTVPHWFLILLTLPLPLRAMLHWRTTRQRMRCGLCVECGYDLRASTDRCPECGAEVSP